MFFSTSTQIIAFFSLICEIEASCRTLNMRTIVNGKALTNHTIRTIQPIKDGQTCRIQCYLEPLCFAVNYCQENGREAVCELTNSVTIKHEYLINKQDCTIYSSESSCSSFPCPKNASCHGDFLDDPVPYKCICPAGFTGTFCETDIDECALNVCHEDATCNNSIGSYNCTCKKGYHGNGKTCQETNECTSNDHNCDANAICKNTIGGFNCTCKSGLYGNGTFCKYVKTCDDIFRYLPGSTDGYYSIDTADGDVIELHCMLFVEQQCGSGPWTMALKIDGNKDTFKFSSPLWTDKNTLNPESSTTAFDDDSEIKLPDYWTKPVTKLCLGMKDLNTVNWISLDITAPSLYSLIARGQSKVTNKGRTKWASLLSPPQYLQHNCKREGINVECTGLRTRIGYIGNGEDDCESCDTYIGFGPKSKGCGTRDKPTFCYILIK